MRLYQLLQQLRLSQLLQLLRLSQLLQQLHLSQLLQQLRLSQLLQLLRSLSPGALRPCDAVMSSLLSCSVELGSLRELTSWLAFTLVTFLVVLQLSPEEAVLGRLQVPYVSPRTGGGFNCF